MGLVAFEISWVKTPFHPNANHPQPLNQFTRVSRQDAHCGVLFCTFNPDFDIYASRWGPHPGFKK